MLSFASTWRRTFLLWNSSVGRGPSGSRSSHCVCERSSLSPQYRRPPLARPRHGRRDPDLRLVFEVELSPARDRPSQRLPLQMAVASHSQCRIARKASSLSGRRFQDFSGTAVYFRIAHYRRLSRPVSGGPRCTARWESRLGERASPQDRHPVALRRCAPGPTANSRGGSSSRKETPLLRKTAFS